MARCYRLQKTSTLALRPGISDFSKGHMNYKPLPQSCKFPRDRDHDFQSHPSFFLVVIPVILLGLPKAVLFLEGEVEMLVAQPRVASQGVCVWKCRRALLG